MLQRRMLPHNSNSDHWHHFHTASNVAKQRARGRTRSPLALGSDTTRFLTRRRITPLAIKRGTASRRVRIQTARLVLQSSPVGPFIRSASAAVASASASLAYTVVRRTGRLRWSAIRRCWASRCPDRRRLKPEPQVASEGGENSRATSIVQNSCSLRPRYQAPTEAGALAPKNVL